jgi:predicted nucleic acid-binding protein
LVTTSLVVAESHALIVRAGGYDSGLRFLESVLLPSGPAVDWVDETVMRAAVDRWVRPYRDKDWSMTDAVSFEVMQRNRIREAFAFDDHFRQAGFTLL